MSVRTVRYRYHLLLSKISYVDRGKLSLGKSLGMSVKKTGSPALCELNTCDIDPT